MQKGEVEEGEWGMAADVYFPELAADLGAGLEVCKQEQSLLKSGQTCLRRVDDGLCWQW